MKFIEQLRALQAPEWSQYYVDFERLKDMIVKESAQEESKQNEKQFKEELNSEVEKVNSFYTSKGEELLKRVAHIITSLENEVFDAVEIEMDKITKELIQLEQYQRLNIIAFRKLAKKHDEITDIDISAWFMLKLETEDFVRPDPLDEVQLALSKAWSLIHKRQDQQQEPQEDITNQGDAPVGKFERKTFKYWIREDDVMKIKCEILKHLPIYVFNNEGKTRSLLTSVYYDSEELMLYHQRLRRCDGARNLRMRTYEGKNETVFVERKMHHPGWIGESSVKSRFGIQESKLYSFLKGEYRMDEYYEQLHEQGQMKPEEAEEAIRLANEIQTLVVDNKLKPALITRYYRTAFQRGEDVSLRISIDTRVHMIADRTWDEPNISKLWGRNLDANPPNDNEVCWFPYAILELKLASEEYSDPTMIGWLNDMISSGLVIETQKFSKFSHGCCTLLPHRVTVLPPWLSLLTSQTLTPTTLRRALVLQADSESNQELNQEGISYSQHLPRADLSQYVSGLNNKDDDDDKSQRQVFEMKNPQEPKVEDDKKKKSSGSFSVTVSKIRHRITKSLQKDEKTPTQMPMRIEPKVYFANERTMLKWLHLLIILQTLGIAIIALSNGSQSIALIGFVMVLAAMLFMIYALIMFHRRRQRINERKITIDDKWGPTVFVGLLLTGVCAAVISNLYSNAIFSSPPPTPLNCTAVRLLNNTFFKYKPTGLVWLPTKQLLATTETNLITLVDVYTGQATTDYNVYGAFNSLTYVPSLGEDQIFLGIGYPPSILQYDLVQRAVVTTYALNIPTTGTSKGLGAITFVPIAGHPAGGSFYVGSATNGLIYVFDIPVSSTTGGGPTSTNTFQIFTNAQQVTALSYFAPCNCLYGIVDNWMFVMNPFNGTIINHWLFGVPGAHGIQSMAPNDYSNYIHAPGATTAIYVSSPSIGYIQKFPFNQQQGIISGRCVYTISSNNSTTTY